MPKFKLKWSESVIQYWEKEVEAESVEEAEKIFQEGNHYTGDEELVETNVLESFLEGAEPIVEQDENRCYLCGETESQVTELIVEGDRFVCDNCLTNR